MKITSMEWQSLRNGEYAAFRWRIFSSRNGIQKTYLSSVSRNCFQPTEISFKCDTVLHRMAFVQQVKKLPTFYEPLKLSPSLQQPATGSYIQPRESSCTYEHAVSLRPITIIPLQWTRSSRGFFYGIQTAILQVQYFSCYYYILTTFSIFTRSE
jgi:hypothetical protein